MSQSLQPPHRVVTSQQNEMHQPQQQQQHQQQPIPMNTNDIISIESEFSALHHPNEKIDEQIETKYDILFTCLKAVKWKLVVDDNNAPLLLSPGTKYDELENLFEGEAYIYAFAYGHQKSDKTLELCNELYLEYVLGTEMGRGLIQQHISSLTSSLTPPTTPPRADQKCKELADDSFDLMMGKLSIEDRTPLQQNEEAIAAAKLLLERLEADRERLLLQESKKRQLELVSHGEVEQSRHPSTNDNTKEKKQRTEKEEDDVDDDSINAARDMEFEASIDMESDNESESMLLDNTDVSLLDNKDASAGNYIDEEDQAPQDESMCASMDIDSNPEVSTWPPSELQQQIDELENSKQINHIISSDDNLNKKMQLLLQELNNNDGDGFHLFIKLVSSHPATKVVLWTRFFGTNLSI